MLLVPRVTARLPARRGARRRTAAARQGVRPDCPSRPSCPTARAPTTVAALLPRHCPRETTWEASTFQQRPILLRALDLHARPKLTRVAAGRSETGGHSPRTPSVLIRPTRASCVILRLPCGPLDPNRLWRARCTSVLGRRGTGVAAEEGRRRRRRRRRHVPGRLLLALQSLPVRPSLADEFDVPRPCPGSNFWEGTRSVIVEGGTRHAGWAVMWVSKARGGGGTSAGRSDRSEQSTCAM